MTPDDDAGACCWFVPSGVSLSFGIDDDERRELDEIGAGESERPAGHDAGHGVKCGVKLGR